MIARFDEVIADKAGKQSVELIYEYIENHVPSKAVQ